MPGVWIKLPLVENHAIKKKCSFCYYQNQQPRLGKKKKKHFKRVAASSTSPCKAEKHTWSREAENPAYPYDDPFRDVGSQQVELVLVSSIQPDHQHEVSNSETAG